MVTKEKGDDMNIFDYLYEDFRFDKPIKTLTLFSGIGFQETGMDLAKIPYEMVGTSEIDKFAILSYAAIHTDYLKIRNDYDFPEKEEMVEYLQERNVGINLKTNSQTIKNSTNIETVKDFYLACVLNNNFGDISKLKGKDIKSEIDIMTYSFPCQDLSKAGKQQGMGKGSRSGLVYEVLRILQELKETNNLPKVLIMENVTDLVGAKFINEFNQIKLEIEGFGYTNHVENLNSKNYGIAQNRNRTFMVSILGDYNYEFPKQFNLTYRLKDYLENEVDEKYYLSGRALNGIKNTTFNSSTLAARTEKDGVIPTLCARDYKDPKLVVENTKSERIGGIFDKDGKRHQAGSIWDKEHLAPTLDTMQGGWRQPSIVVGSYNYGSSDKFMEGKSRLVKNPDVSNTIITSPNVGLAIENNRFFRQALETLDENEVEFGDSINAYNKSVDRSGQSPTITTRPEGFKTAILPVTNNLRIRKLTPTETGRLMGMNDEQINKQLEVVSNAQAYKQHGNGIVAQVIGLIIGMMVYEDENELREMVMKNSHTWLSKRSRKYD